MTLCAHNRARLVYGGKGGFVGWIRRRAAPCCLELSFHLASKTTSQDSPLPFFLRFGARNSSHPQTINNIYLHIVTNVCQIVYCERLGTSLQKVSPFDTHGGGKPCKNVVSSVVRTTWWPLQCFVAKDCIRSKTLPVFLLKWESKMRLQMSPDNDRNWFPKVGAERWRPKLETKVGDVSPFAVLNDTLPTCVLTPN